MNLTVNASGCDMLQQKEKEQLHLLSIDNLEAFSMVSDAQLSEPDDHILYGSMYFILS